MRVFALVLDRFPKFTKILMFWKVGSGDLILASWIFWPETHFLDILEIFRLDFDEISFNLVKKAFPTWQLVFLSTSIASYDILARA